MAIGSSLSPGLADIFLSHIEYKLDGAIRDTCVYIRSVDDTFLLCKMKDFAEELLALFHSAHPNMKIYNENNLICQILM